ncbi:MAG: folate family ECF transporter S component [Firmicutes bacterium]|nr:folate family ECF transporter S component [Candidatus Fermentithermobacillaceae bacterium]
MARYAERLRHEPAGHNRVRDVVFVAMMAALSVVLTRYASIRIALGGVEGIRIGFGSIPNVMVGFVISPVAGAISGAVADVAGFFLSPMGSYMPHFTVTAALAGFIPGAVYRLLRKDRGKKLEVWATVLSVMAGQVTVSLGLTPYFLHYLFGLPWPVLIPPRLVSLVVELPVSVYVIKTVSDPLIRLRQATCSSDA